MSRSKDFIPIPIVRSAVRTSLNRNFVSDVLFTVGQVLYYKSQKPKNLIERDFLNRVLQEVMKATKRAYEIERLYYER